MFCAQWLEHVSTTGRASEHVQSIPSFLLSTGHPRSALWPGEHGSHTSERPHVPLSLQELPDFRLTQDAFGKPLLEDGKGRCPFDPEYKSTAILVGKDPRRAWDQGAAGRWGRRERRAEARGSFPPPSALAPAALTGTLSARR